MPDYSYNGEIYAQNDIQEAANKVGLELEEYLAKHNITTQESKLTYTEYFDEKGKRYLVDDARIDQFKAANDLQAGAHTREEWKKMQKDYEKYKKDQEKRAKENENKRLEKEKLDLAEQEQAQVENIEKINEDFKHEFTEQTPKGSYADRVLREEKIAEAQKWSIEDKIKYLHKHTNKTYEKELSFEEPEILTRDEKLKRAEELESEPGFIGPSAVVENPDSLNMYGVTTIPEKVHVSTLGDDYKTLMDNFKSDREEIFQKFESGEIDRETAQEALNTLQKNQPNEWEVKPLFITEDTIETPEESQDSPDYANIVGAAVSPAYNVAKLAMAAKEGVKDIFSDDEQEELTLDGKIDKIEREAKSNFTEEELKLYDDSLYNPDNLGLLANSEEKFAKQQEIINSILTARQEKLDLYHKGEIELTTEELGKIAILDPTVIDYVKKFLPSAEEMVAEEDSSLEDQQNVINSLNKATNEAVISDPKFQFIQTNILKEVDKDAKTKLDEITKKYKLHENPTQDNLEKAQEEFTDWYNESVGDKLQNNKELKRLYQMYGVATSDSFGKLNQDYLREKDPFLRQIDDTINRFKDDDSWRGEFKEWSAKIREARAALPTKSATWWNEAQISAQQWFTKKRTDEGDMIQKLIDDGLSPTMTVKEARELDPKGKLNRYLNTWRGTRDDDKTLKELLDNKKADIKSVDDSIAEDIGEMLQAYEDSAKYKTYDSGKELFTLEGFLDRVAGFVDQAPHMVPTMIGQGLVTAGGVMTATGVGAPLGGTIAGIGVLSIAAGSMVQGAMEYGGTYMDGVRRQLTEELGREPTAKEYLGALKKEGYSDQTAALTAGALVMGTEFLSDYLTSKLTGSVGGWIAKTGAGKAILGNTFTKYLASVGAGGFGMKLNAYQEYLTEGFQEYLGQVADNYIDKFTHGKEVDNIFTSNIRVDEIQEAARMGYKQGELFGGVALVSTGVGLNQLQKSYIQQAEDIAYNINMIPGSKTYKAANAAFKKLEQNIRDDKSLSKAEILKRINEISRIREAAMLTPDNVTGKAKAKLMKLLIEQRQLKNEIKATDNKELSVNKIERKNKIDAEIESIIKTADEISESLKGDTVGQSIVPTGSKGKNIETLAKEYKKNPGSADTLDLLSQYQKIALKALGYDTRAGTIKRDQALSFVGEYFDKILESWDPAQGSLSNWITNNIAPKKVTFYGKEQQLKEKGKSTRLEDTQELQAGQDQETQGKEFEKRKYPTDVAAIEKQTANVRPEILTNIKNSVKQFIASSVGKKRKIGEKGKTAIIKLDPSSLAKELKAQNKATKVAVAAAMGKSVKAKNDFITKVINDGYIETIPIAAMKKRFKTVKGFNIEKIGRETLGAGTGIYKLSGLDKQALIDFYTKDQSGRRSFIDLLAKGLTIEQFQEVKIDTEFMNDLAFKLKEAKSELTAEEFMNEVEREYDGRSKEFASLDKTESIRSKPKTAQEAAENAIKEIITEENKDNFKDKDVLDRAIEYFEGIDQDFKNTLGANPIQIFIKGVKAALKAIKLALKQGSILKQAIIDGLKVLKNELKFLSESKRFVKKITEKFSLKNIESYPYLKAGGELSLKKILGFETADINSKAYKELRKKEITKFLDSLPATKREKYRRYLRDSMVHSHRTNYTHQSEFDKDFPGPDYTTQEKRKLGFTESYTTAHRLTKRKVEKIKTKEFQDEQDARVEDLIEFFKDLGEYAAKNQESIPVWDSMINDAGNNMHHFVKTHAPIRFYPININTGNPDFKLTVDEEHSMPSQNVGRLLFLAGFTGQIDIISPVIKAGYMQGALSAAEHERLNSKEIGLKDKMNEAFDLVFKGLINGDIKQTKDGLSSLIRYTEGNFINPNQYIMAKTGKTIAEEFEVQVEKKYRKAANVIAAQNKAITRILQGENENKVLKDFKAWGKKIGIMQNTAAKKINKVAPTITDESQTAAETKETLENSQDTQANAQKVNKKKKGISVFDFDDTLAKTKEQVIVNMPPIILEGLSWFDKMAAKEFAKSPDTRHLRPYEWFWEKNFKKVIHGRMYFPRTVYERGVFADLYERRNKVKELDTDYSAEELRTKLKKAKGKTKENIELALQEKFKKLPEAVRDAGIDIYTGKPISPSMKLTPAEFAEQAQDLESKGASFDFSQFEDVKGAKKGPLADLALKRQGKFGSGDIFILTARPQTSAQGIKTFLDGIGLNIPIENIIGLEDGTSQAKARWVLSKTKEGYNDFYFADDVIQNVKAVKQILDQVDVKSKVQQAITDKETSLDKEFNEMLEESQGVKSQAKYSPVRAQLEGKKKDKGFFKWLGRQLTITPSAEDFLGLMYDLMGSGKQGNRHAKWIKDNLIDPYNKAEQTILSAKVTVANDFAALKKAFPSLRSSVKGNPLMDQMGVGPYTKSQAMRVYIWNKQGMEIPGLSKRDQNALVAAVEADSELSVFADNVILIQKDKQYPAPSKNWAGGTIDGDLMFSIDQTLRRKVMTEFDENAKIIFSEKNMNKLEAIYGKKWVEALKDSLRRMQSGSNRPVYQGGGARIVNEMLDWLNGSVGAVMFLNMKSGLLQLISNVNFINWGDNNIYAAAKAFASKEYWPTVMKLMNSDYLVNRRDGLRINVNEAELANAAKDRGMKGAIAYLLDKGFIITRIMDSLAIATGGATFYINRRDALLQRQNPETGKKYTQVEAETKAFDDFYAISEESQQSSNPSKISQQQASLAGRVILAFQNVTMQYNRMTKKAIRDLYNRRKKPGMTQRESDMSNLSKIVYYTTIQNVIFNSLQQALFVLAFDDETDEEEKNRLADIANGMADSLLFGLGFGGAAISTVKNVLLKVMEERAQKSPDYEEAVWEVFNISPVLDSKVRKLRTTAKTFNWNMEEIRKRGWSLDNPSYLAISQLLSAGTNIPLDRVLRKIMNMRQAMDEETRTWQRVALILGWSSWSVGLPYWGLQSTIDQEEIAIEKAKKDYKNDIRKIKASGYKKVMYRNLKDFDPKDIIELQSPAGTVVYYVKVGKGKQVKN